MVRAHSISAAVALFVFAVPLNAQGYRVRLDTRFQSVAFRGVVLDSILAIDAVVGSTGGFETRDGFAVRCTSGVSYCTYFRPGSERNGGPWVTTADFALWSLGLPGLSIRGKARLGVDLGDDNAWPGTDPAVHLLEGYLEYASPMFTVELGRTHITDRFGFTGFDGGKLDVRLLAQRLKVTAYGGSGLSRGVDLPVTSGVLNPLDDFQPQKRQLVGGGLVAWSSPSFDARIQYQREVDPRSDYFVSERTGVGIAIRPVSAITASGGVDYDIAAGWLGSAEGQITYTAPKALGAITLGARRYRPHFGLWTIWGAFSPVPYRAAFGHASARPLEGMEFRARGEIYEFDAAEAATPLVQAEQDGWRWSTGFTFSRYAWWQVDWDFHKEFGPGASSIGFDLRGSVEPASSVRLSAQLALLRRPLEFRFDDAKLWAYGVHAEYRPAPDLRFNFSAVRYDETRRRPDAAQFDWNQLRIEAGASIAFGTPDQVRGLHPSILRIPYRSTH